MTPMFRKSISDGRFFFQTSDIPALALALALVIAEIRYCILDVRYLWSNVLAICVCGASQALGRMCWLYVCLWHLVVCVGYTCMCVCGTWSYVLAICVSVAPNRMCWLYVCLWHLIVCVGYMCVCVVLDRHLVYLVLAALWLYVKWGTWRAPDAREEWPL